MPWSAVLLASLPAIWLIPQHYLPWLAAHQDFAALMVVTIAGLLSRPGQALPWAWAIALGVAIISVALQRWLGLIAFSGDAWMTALYLLAFAGAIAVGSAAGTEAKGTRWLDGLALGTTGAAILSVAVALMQWTGTGALPLPVDALMRGDRPYANFAQANNFCTALFMGLCAVCWLRESRRIGAVAWGLAAVLLLFGMTMSGSRTGWLQIGLAVGLVAWVGRRTMQPQLRLPHALTLLAMFAVLVLTWSALNEALLLTGDRSASDQAQAGLRLPIWQLAIDAISRQPLWGYGWQQIPSAQWAVALDHVPLQRYFDYSHSLALDLVLWAGLPIGGLVAVCACFALVRQVRALDDARVLWLFAAVLGFFAHALVEMPHAYAYLLMPVGVALGVVHALCPGQLSLPLRPALTRAGWIAMGAALLITAADYMKVEQNYRTARMELAFGDRQIVTPAPDLHVLSQLRAFMWLIRSEARPNMSPADLDAMRTITQRYPHPPALLRLALAEGLNGQPKAADETLRKLCAMHLPARCDEARESWLALQQRYPVLAAVPAPPAPPR